MKKIFFICYIVLSPFCLFAQQYTVVLRLGHLDNPWNPLHPTEWRLHNLYADIFDVDGNLISASPEFIYTWQKYDCDGNGFQFWDETTGPTNFVIPDGHNNVPSACNPNLPFQTYFVYVIVNINGSSYESEIVQIPDNESGTLGQKRVDVTQHRTYNQIIGEIGKIIGNKFYNYPAPFTFYYPQTINNDFYRASQGLFLNPDYKYNHWIGFSDVTNHRSFTFTGSITNLISQLSPVQFQIKIQNSLEGTSLNIGNINFADPWYIDYADPLFGNSIRNRGMKDTGSDALQYRTRTSPFYPNDTTEYQNGSDPAHPYQGVFLNQDPTFDSDIPNYSVQAVTQDIPMGGKYGTRPFYFQRWVESDGVQYEHSGNATTGVVFTSSGATATAVMKGHLLSDKNTAFASNGQRNLIRDDNSIYHLFYISMYKIWHTHSLTSDFNGAWSQEEEVQLAYGTYHPVSLSVDYNGSDQIAILYVGEDAYMYHTIINKNTGAVVDTHIYAYVTLDYNYINSVLPVAAFSPNQLIVVYKPSASSGLYYARKYRTIDTWTYQEGIQILNTDFTSHNPTIASIKDGSASDIFFLAFQQGNINTTINYCEVVMSQTLNFNISTVSTGSGYNINYSPSISLYRVSDDWYKPMVSWTARTTGTLSKIGSMEGAEIPEPRMVCRQKNSDNTWGSCFAAGQYVNYSNNNSVVSGGLNQSVIVWSQSDGVEAKWVRRDGTSYSGYTCLEPAGLIPNVSTGINFSSIKAFTSDATTLPTILNPAITNFNSTPECNQQKVMTLFNLTYSRSGVIIKNGIEFVFNTGDVINGDSVIRFIDKPDTLIYNSTEELNSSLRTQDFALNQNSSLLFTNYYYVINKEASDSLLSETESVNFKVELVNSATDQVAGIFDNITFRKDNLDDYENVSYEIDCTGISAGTYYLRIVTGVSGNAEYNLINTQNDASNIAKKSYDKVGYSGQEVPVTYDLSQNFPNPFNPSTTINYQLPQTGHVTLKIYDILGKEVATLVNEEKNQGKYSVNFDVSSGSSRMASGVYIYRLRVNDYVSSKKMLLLK